MHMQEILLDTLLVLKIFNATKVVIHRWSNMFETKGAHRQFMSWPHPVSPTKPLKILYIQLCHIVQYFISFVPRLFWESLHTLTVHACNFTNIHGKLYSFSKFPFHRPSPRHWNTSKLWKFYPCSSALIALFSRLWEAIMEKCLFELLCMHSYCCHVISTIFPDPANTVD